MRGATQHRLDLLWVCVLCAVAVAVRWALWEHTAAINNDGPVFVGLARLFAAGEWAAALGHDYHPLYPALMAALAPVFGGEETAGAAISALSGGVATAVCFALVDQVFGRRPAWIAATALAFHPYAASYASDVQSDGLYLALFLAAALFLWRALSRPSAAAAAAAGGLAGLAYLTRPEGLGVVVVGGALATLAALRGRRALGQTGGWLLALALGTALVAGPYLVQIRIQSGQWAISQKKSLSELSGLGASRARARPAAPDPALLAARPFLETVLHGPRAGRVPLPLPGQVLDPPSAPRAAFSLVSALWSAMRPELFGLALLGVFLRRRQPERGFFLGFALLYGVVLFGLAYGAGYLNRRHTLPLGVLLLGYAGVALPALMDRALAWRWPRATRTRDALAVVLGIALVLGFALPKLAKPKRVDRLASRRAAEWLREHALPRGPVAAEKQRVAYYANAPYVPLPLSGNELILDYLRSAGARYVILDEKSLEADGGLRRAAREGMKMLHRTEGAGGSASVYALTEPAGP